MGSVGSTNIRVARKFETGTGMRIRDWAAVFVVLLAIAPACSPQDEEEAKGDEDAVAVEIVVEQDDIFGFSKDRVIGDVWFSDSQGPVGTPVEVVVQFDEFERFKDNPLQATIALLNPNATKDGEWIQEFEVDAEREELDLIVPQTISIPAVLNFEVRFSAVDAEDPEDVFEASLVFQFLVNQGSPATI